MAGYIVYLAKEDADWLEKQAESANMPPKDFLEYLITEARLRDEINNRGPFQPWMPRPENTDT